MIGGNVVNILGNWVLIYGVGLVSGTGFARSRNFNLGKPHSHGAGDGGHVVVGQEFRGIRHDIIHTSLNKADFQEMNRLGWPVALQLAMESAAFTLSCVMVGWLGTIPSGRSSGDDYPLAALLSRDFRAWRQRWHPRESLYGTEGLHGAVRRNAYDGFAPEPAVLLCMGMPVFLLRHQIGGWFNDNTEVQAYVAALIILMMVYQFGDGLQYTFANALPRYRLCKTYGACMPSSPTSSSHFHWAIPLGFTCGIGHTGHLDCLPVRTDDSRRNVSSPI